MVCQFCGDPISQVCRNRIKEWRIYLPAELKPGDILRFPMNGKNYAVSKIVQDGDTIHIFTRQFRKITVYTPNLGMLAKRETECGWPCCELHCAKCISRAAERRGNLLVAEGLGESRN